MSDQTKFNVQKLVESTHHLVSLPQVVLSLLSKINDEQASMDDIALLIKQDPAITSELIRLCNSPMYYSSGEPVYSIEEAVKLVGTEQVISLCLALCACEATSELANEVIEMRDFWQHCLLTACISSVLADKITGISRGAAFTGGLLHDIGQLPMFYQYPIESNRVLEFCQLHPERRIVEAEKEIFGFTHEDVGRLLAEKWGFPPKLGLCMSRHHCGAWDTGEDALAMVVHVSNILSEALETQEDPESYLDAIDTSALTLVITDIETLPMVFEKASSYFEDVKSTILV